MNDFVTIATYEECLSANFDKQKLEEVGIDCYLADENIITTQWTLKNAVGGIKLRVPKQQADAASKIINEPTEELAVDFNVDQANAGIICPKCGSNNTATEKYSKSMAMITWMTLGFPILARPVKDHRCFYCNNKWKT